MSGDSGRPTGPGETAGADPAGNSDVWLIVPCFNEGTVIEDVLAVMQRTGTHLARVRGEDGTVRGVVFLEDILEELVGEVSDSMQRHGARS